MQRVLWGLSERIHVQRLGVVATAKMHCNMIWGEMLTDANLSSTKNVGSYFSPNLGVPKLRCHIFGLDSACYVDLHIFEPKPALYMEHWNTWIDKRSDGWDTGTVWRWGAKRRRQGTRRRWRSTAGGSAPAFAPHGPTPGGALVWPQSA